MYSCEEWLNTNPLPDLILADIQLSDGVSLDLFSSRKVYAPIVFTTAYNEYAIRAFKLNSIDYLLKPIEKQELAAAFAKMHLLQSKFANGEYLFAMKELMSNFAQSKKYKERFAVHMGRSVTLVSVSDVMLFCKEELIYLHTRDERKLITDYRSLDEIEELVDPTNFFRANRQHLVHLPMIESYRTDDTGKLFLKMRMSKKSEIVVSKEKAGEFRRWFE